jgi:hypothetical protein
MKRLPLWGLALAVSLLNGCLEVEDELTLQADGSGSVRLVTHTLVPEDTADMLGLAGGFREGGTPTYPPTNEAEARRFFPAKDFTLKVEEKSDKDGKFTTVEATFRDINALLGSPYGRAHQLSLAIDKGVLTLRAQSGGELAARAAEFKADGDMAGLEPPGLEDLKKEKEKMKFTFQVSLPHALLEANGVREGRSVAWAVERRQCKDGEEFAGKLASLLEARCSADGLKFLPAPPPRLGLLPFQELRAGTAASQGTLPATNKILAAARFVPLALQVTRSLDLSGEDGLEESRAQLTGEVILPAELAPPQWGKAKLIEAVDAKGNNLKVREDDLTSLLVRSGLDDRTGREEEHDAAGDSSRQSKEQRRMVTLSFKSPVWQVKKISRIRASLALQYFGGSEVVKLSNAVPARLLTDLRQRSDFSEFDPGGARGQVSDARLTKLGLTLRVQMAMVQNGMTVLSLQTSGGNTTLLDAQVFDGAGRPWPTILPSAESGGAERSFQVVVAGQPKAPLSLGLLVSRVGATVEVPILIENVPAGAN